MIICDKEGIIGNKLTSQGKNAILLRQVTSLGLKIEVKAFYGRGEHWSGKEEKGEETTWQQRSSL
jgi:hypothetical protein